MLTLSMLPEENQSANNTKTKKFEKMTVNFEQFSRFATEEIVRRMIKKDTKPLTGAQILNLLYTDRQDMLEKYKHALVEMQNYEDNKNSKVVETYAKF